MLGGTFDPIHMGHLVIAEAARIKLGLADVIFVPAGQPWLKANRNISPAEHRVAMVRLATGSNPNFSVSTFEVEEPGPSYTVGTMAHLRGKFGPKVPLYFIGGLDALEELPLWKEPQRLITLCRLVGMKRPGARELDLKKLEAAIPGISKRIVILNGPQIGISASDIRERVRAGLSIRYLVPDAVEAYIREKGLYLPITDKNG